MPILSPQFFSTWYTFYDGTYYRLFENWTERQVQDQKKLTLLQGDGGTHVMDIGGIKWETEINSPVIIFESGGTAGLTSVFDLLRTSFHVVQSRTTPNVDYILSGATMKISQEGVLCTLKYLSHIPGAFTPVYGMPHDFIARKARFFDTFFSVLDDETTQMYQIISGEVAFNVQISENYFMNTGSQAPYFGVQGYHINGTIEVLVNPHQGGYNGLFATDQPSGVLDVVNASTALSVAGVNLALGQSQVRGTVTRSMRADAPATASITFDTYSSSNTLL